MANISQLKKVWSFKTVFDHLFTGVVFSETYFHFDKKNATWGFPRNRCLSNPTGSVWYDHRRDHDLTYRFVWAFGLTKLLNLQYMMFDFRNLYLDGEFIILFHLTSRQTSWLAICIFWQRYYLFILLVSSFEYSYMAALYIILFCIYVHQTSECNLNPWLFWLIVWLKANYVFFDLMPSKTFKNLA